MKKIVIGLLGFLASGCQDIGADYVYGYDEFMNDVPVGVSGWFTVVGTTVNADLSCTALGESCCSGAETEDHVVRACNFKDGFAVKIDNWEWR